MKRVCVFTGARADYGLLRPLMEEIKRERTMRLQTLVTCMHLSPEFGMTYKEIEKDGFRIDEKVDILLNSDTPEGISRSAGFGLIGFARAFARLKPDLVVILGDRFECLAAAIAALIARVPVAHLHGGEATFGVMDEAMRHSITKMSYLHFTSTETYRRRVIQLGEDPKRVFNVGALGVENIKRLKLLSRKELEDELGFKLRKHNLLVTFHPVTLEENTSAGQFQNLLKELAALDNTGLIFTRANADTHGRVINRMIDAFVSKDPAHRVAFASMGQLRYLSAMRFVDAVVGNSSSGIIEAPSLKIGTINIGDRQKGRMRAASVIDCGPASKDIRGALKKLYSKSFQEILKDVRNPHYSKSTAKRMVGLIKKADLSTTKKSFFDIKFAEGYRGI